MELLRPAVQSETVRYNMKSRLGKGFSLQELQAVGVPAQFARTIGISVDTRRVNKSQESLDRNVARLKQYLDKLVLFPRKAGQPKKGPVADTTNIDEKSLSQVLGSVLPLSSSSRQAVVGTRAITNAELEGETPVWEKTREAQEQVRKVGKKQEA